MEWSEIFGKLAEVVENGVSYYCEKTSTSIQENGFTVNGVFKEYEIPNKNLLLTCKFIHEKSTAFRLAMTVGIARMHSTVSSEIVQEWKSVSEQLNKDTDYICIDYKDVEALAFGKVIKIDFEDEKSSGLIIDEIRSIKSACGLLPKVVNLANKLDALF